MISTGFGQIRDRRHMPAINGTSSTIPRGTICRFYTQPGDTGASAPNGANASSWTVTGEDPVGMRHKWVKPMEVAGNAAPGSDADRRTMMTDLVVALDAVPAGESGNFALLDQQVQVLAGGTITDGDAVTFDGSGNAVSGINVADDVRVIGYARILTSGIPGGTVAAASLFTCDFDGRCVKGIVQNLNI